MFFQMWVSCELPYKGSDLSGQTERCLLGDPEPIKLPQPLITRHHLPPDLSRAEGEQQSQIQ